MALSATLQGPRLNPQTGPAINQDPRSKWLTVRLQSRLLTESRQHFRDAIAEGLPVIRPSDCRNQDLGPFDCREPGRCAVVVVSRLNPVRFDGGDIPSIAGVERRSQLFLTDGVRASIGTIVTEAQHIQGSILLGHRR